MKNSPLVTVIVPIFNAELYLGRCIESILGQTYKKLEIVLVDDGSKDQSLLVCKKYAKNEPRIIVIHQKNRGVSAARNTGIRTSNGQYTIFVDADDELSNGYIETLVRRAHQSKKNELCGAAIKSMNVSKCDNLVASSENVQIIDEEKYIKAVIGGRIHGSICRFLFATPKGKLEFDEALSYMEDTVFLINYLKEFQVKTVVIDKAAQYIYNDNPKSVSNIGLVKRYIDICASLDVIEKITDKKYTDSISKNRAKFLRWQLNKCCSWRDRNELIDYYKATINLYNNGTSIAEKAFLILIKYNMKQIIRLYYMLYDIKKKNRGKG